MVIPWMRGYSAANLQPDVVAGITLAAYLLPAAIADASLAGLPPQAGLYACLFRGLVFWGLCSFRPPRIAATPPTSLLVGASVGDISHGDAARHVALSMGAAVLVGLFGIAAWAARAG